MGSGQQPLRRLGCVCVLALRFDRKLRVSLPLLTERRFGGAPIKRRAALCEIKNGFMRRPNRGRNLRLSRCNSSPQNLTESRAGKF